MGPGFESLKVHHIPQGVLRTLWEAKKLARWSSGQDGGLSRRKQEFDSPTGHHFPLDKRETI